MEKFKKFWASYRSIIIRNCTDINVDSASADYWQNKLFAASIVYIIPLCFITVIPGIYMAYISDLMGLLAVDFVAIAIVAGIAFFPGISVFARKIMFNGVLYIISTTLLLYLGSLGPGLLYLLGITVFVVLSLDKIYGYFTVALNTLVCIGVGVFIHFTEYDFMLLNEYELGAWIAVSSTMIVLSAAAALLIPILFDNLQTALVQEKELRADMEKDQRWLKLLESAIENTSESIAILEAASSDNTGRKILYVNDAFENMTGYTRKEVIGNSFHLLNGPKTSSEERNKLQKALKEWRSYETEFLNYKKDGSEYWVHVSFAPVMNANNSYSHWVVVGRDVTNRKEREDELRDSLQEKETLLMEIHHRVKNNLAVVSSMMQLQAMEEGDESLQKKLFDSVVRIRTMVTIHELLYESRSFVKIDFSENLKKLTIMIADTIQGNQNVSINLDCDHVIMNVNQAIPMSLIVNEVITNVYKHAFPKDRLGNITVTLKEHNGMVDLSIFDNGIGLPGNFEEKKSTSLGIKLIDVLSQQLDTTYDFKKMEKGGTTFQISMQKSRVKGIGNAYLNG